MNHRPEPHRPPVGEPNELAQAVAAAVNALPRPEQEAVVLRHYQGLSFSQIAEVLGEPVTTIKSRTLQGLKRLRATLDPAYARPKTEEPQP